MRSRVVAVDPAAEYGDGRPTRRQCPSMGLAVDAARQPAHDDRARRRRIPGEKPGDRPAVARARPRADDGDGWPGKHVERSVSPHPDHRRRVGDLQEKRRIPDGTASNGADRHGLERAAGDR